MATTSIVTILVATMVALSPPGRQSFIPEAQETREIALDRYNSIAQLITEIAYDKSEEPIGSRKFTASLLFSITYHESAGWRRDVDLGLGRARLAKKGWNDAGRSWCLGQLNLGSGVTQEGWTGTELVTDREKCLRATLHAARRSFLSCSRLPMDQRLSVYASGNCDSEAGQIASERRVRFARRIVGKLVEK
jgi:hypothetical protein